MRQFVVILWSAWLLSGAASIAEEGYKQPDFNVALFEQSALTLPQNERIELAWALTGLARNFPDDTSISPRAKSMALLLSHHFLPYDRDTVVGNFHLRHGLATLPTGHYGKKEDITARMESVLAVEGVDEADQQLQSLLSDLLNELHDLEPAERSLWNDAVAPTLRPLKKHTARVQFFDEAGRLQHWSVTAMPLSEEGKFSVTYRNTVQSLSSEFQEDLAARHPFVARHLELLVSGSSISRPSRARLETLVGLLIDQLVEGWKWDLSMALCGVGEGLSEERRARMVDKSASVEHGLEAILTPALPPVSFRNWMAFNQLDRLTRMEFIAADSVAEVIAWHQDNLERDDARALFRRCGPMMGKRITGPDEISKNGRLSAWLAQIESAYPQHLSTTILRKYGTLAKPPRATLEASLEWLDTQARKVMSQDQLRHNRTFLELTCEPMVKRLWKIDDRLDSRVKRLSDALSRYIEHHSIPYCRVNNKSTKTARRQGSKLTAAQDEWRRMKRRLEDEIAKAAARR